MPATAAPSRGGRLEKWRLVFGGSAEVAVALQWKSGIDDFGTSPSTPWRAAISFAVDGDEDPFVSDGRLTRWPLQRIEQDALLTAREQLWKMSAAKTGLHARFHVRKDLDNAGYDGVLPQGEIGALLQRDLRVKLIRAPPPSWLEERLRRAFPPAWD